jgi:hypothetical protein
MAASSPMSGSSSLGTSKTGIPTHILCVLSQCVGAIVNDRLMLPDSKILLTPNYTIELDEFCVIFARW